MSQQTAYEISRCDWSSDVCSSDLHNKQKWEEYYSAARAYYKEHGNLEVPAKYVTADGIPLGRWLSNQTNSKIGRASCRERV